MILRSKSIREPPLLTPPPAREWRWMEITPEDVELMEKAVSLRRRERNIEGLRMIRTYMGALGLINRLPKDEETVFGRQLDEARESQDGYRILRYRYLLSRAGMPHPKAAGDDKAVKARLKKFREDGNYGLIADMFHWMHGLKEKVPATQADIQTLEKILDNERGGRSLFPLDVIILGLKAAGVDVKVGWLEKDRLVSHYADRRRNMDGTGLAHAHYDARELFGYPPKEENTPMPELKRFGGMR